jgi:sulfatase maturation enzyme AslB (radical SAM superfamily)
MRFAMDESYFKGYWMATNRCNLDCSYCVLEDAPYQLRRELPLSGKIELVTHLYRALNFRRLTLSGGEITLIGKRPPTEFLELLRHLRTFKSAKAAENLEVEIYTNGAFLDEVVADEMAGVVDLVAVTIDGSSDELLTKLGRNSGRFQTYFAKAVRTCGLLSERSIQVKLHTVVASFNISSIAKDAPIILDSVERNGGRVSKWKFYQYMSYDDPDRDAAHVVRPDDYSRASREIARGLDGRGITLHFKGNEEMNSSLFNILSYGNAQYMRPGDTWTQSRRTRDLRTYSSMKELFAQNDINEQTFRQFHELKR